MFVYLRSIYEYIYTYIIEQWHEVCDRFQPWNVMVIQISNTFTNVTSVCLQKISELFALERKDLATKVVSFIASFLSL